MARLQSPLLVASSCSSRPRCCQPVRCDSAVGGVSLRVRRPAPPNALHFKLNFGQIIPPQLLRQHHPNLHDVDNSHRANRAQFPRELSSAAVQSRCCCAHTGMACTRRPVHLLLQPGNRPPPVPPTAFSTKHPPPPARRSVRPLLHHRPQTLPPHREEPPTGHVCRHRPPLPPPPHELGCSCDADHQCCVTG